MTPFLLRSAVALSLLAGALSGLACREKHTVPAEAPLKSSAGRYGAESEGTPSGAPERLDKASPVQFTDVTQQAGILFRHNNGAFGKKYLPETMGSGCAFIDYDNDGWQDLLLVNSTDFRDSPKQRPAVMALYHNNQNGTFTDVTRPAGLAKAIYGLGAAIGDYDNDGWEDIFVTSLGPSHLFRNLGGGRFADVTGRVGLSGVSPFSTSAAWLDYDKDGMLDLYVCNYVDWSIEKDLFCTLDGRNKSYCTPESYQGQSPRCYRNLGGRFEDVTERAGLLDPTNKSLGVVTFDYDDDGWPDIFVANDTQPNKLYRNNGHGGFLETGVGAGVAFSEDGKARAGMGVDAADYDGSGYPSLIIGNFSNEMVGLYHNEGRPAGLFIDEAPSSAIGRATLLTLTFGLFFFDYDLDGQPDIFLANGHVADDINRVQPSITYAQRAQLFHNQGRKRFTDVSETVGKPFELAIVARGAAHGDYDNDGDLDILVTTNAGPAYLWRNEGGNRNRWIRFKTIGTASNRDGIGAKVTIELASGIRQRQGVHSGSSYCSQSELPLTFGLGEAEGIARAEVEWPSGKVDRLPGLDANQNYVIKEGVGIIGQKTPPARREPHSP